MTMDFKLAVYRHIKVDHDHVKELLICKEPLSKEVMLKNKALKQKESIQQMLQTATGEIGQNSYLLVPLAFLPAPEHDTTMEHISQDDTSMIG
ncbi:hypothetical protein Nepgr_005536 [Nepenthes gracilis]|uniref:Uncharacterized protein n=1 Tax=Nepenthes gracilis TaxID=150966 RepID=A0AAD3S3B3_NEPGR|nr:hypothetical protein Nepgr_005536 [Nepenthes gracilis]